jgi:hypothetical protein
VIKDGYNGGWRSRRKEKMWLRETRHMMGKKYKINRWGAVNKINKIK